MKTATSPNHSAQRELPDAAEAEIVVLAGTDAALLVDFVRRLDAHLRAEPFGPLGSSSMATPITIAVADALGEGGASWVASEELADTLASTSLMWLPDGLDHKQRRALFASREASVVAFVRPRADADLTALLAPLRRTPALRALALPHLDEPMPRRGISRRGALGAIGGIGLTVLLAACGKSTSTDTTAAATDTSTATDTTVAPAADTTSAAVAASAETTAAAASGAAVALAPELTEGPYYLDLDLVRSDIVEDRVGAKFALGLRVIEASTGKAIEGAAVDIWHCDANGVYSGFQSQSTGANGGGAPGGGAPPGDGGAPPAGGAPGQSSGSTDDSTFLRGTQLSDASGLVRFATIYPGWYTGRAVHIHVKVHVDGSVIHIGQLFFDDTFTDTVYADNAPYSSRAARDLRNDNDGIFQQGGSSTVLAVTKSGSAYAAELAMGVQKA